MLEKLSIYSPWVTYAKKLEALFNGDDQVDVVYNSIDVTVKILVNGNKSKCQSIRKLLPSSVTFGDVILDVLVVDREVKESLTVDDLEEAFKGNRALSHITTISDIPGVIISNPITYCVFEKEIVQYAADDLGSESGFKSTLYESLARELLNPIDGVYYCTDVISG